MFARRVQMAAVRLAKLFIFIILGPMVLDAVEASNKIVCYLFTWAIYRTHPMNYGIDDVPGNLCTHLIYAYLGLDEKTNEIKFPDKYFDYNECGSDDMTCQNKSSSESHSLNRRFEKLAALRLKWPNLKIMISVGGWLENGAKYSLMISEKGSRKKFISSVMSFLSQYKLDGLDLDWKYPGVPWRGGEPFDVTNFSHLLKELKGEFVKRNYILSAIVPIVESYVKSGYDVGEISRHLDQIHVMAFHLRTNWTGFADIHSPLYPRSFDTFDDMTLNVRDGLKMWVDAGVPKNKLIVGVPFFGKSFTLKDPKKNTQKSPITQSGLGVAGNYSHEPGFLTYYEICAQVESGKWTRKWDTQGKAPYAFYKDQWVGYEDDESLAAKMEFIKNEGYGGAMIWSIDMDDFTGVCGQKNWLLTIINIHLMQKDELAGFLYLLCENQ